MWKWRYSKRDILSMIREPWKRPIVSMHVAARMVQKFLRGGMTRRRLRGLSKPRAQPPVIDATQWLSGMKGISTVRIQRFYRSNIRFLRFRKYRLYTIAVTEISLWRRSLKTEPERAAAMSMQRLYRRYCDRKVFQYYRDLLNFQNSGDPKEMLRSINPSEVALMDGASGAIVRFRLGGTSYPPDIFYKIFTKSAVCDVGSFAPRKYTANQRPSQEFLHNKSYDENGRELVSDAAVRVGKKVFAAKIAGGPPPFQEADESSEWYLRQDRNGWRSVAAKSLDDAKYNPVTSKTSRYQLPYHYSKLKRKENKEAQRKAAKREWMRKLYGLGLANEKDELQRNRSQFIRKTAVEKKHLLQPEDEEYLFDFDSENWEREADAMLEWSDNLDFEEYLSDWHTVATSNVVGGAGEDAADEGGEGKP